MAIVEVKVPELSESVAEATLLAYQQGKPTSAEKTDAQSGAVSSVSK